MRSRITECGKYESLSTALLWSATPGLVLSTVGVPSPLSRWHSPSAIEKQLKICGYKSNVDVVALYLARQGLRSIPSLSQFRRLRYLWINNNKIQDLTFLIKNYYLTELYLNNNELTDISDLFHNPLEYDPDYRLYVIYFLPSVQLLDRKLVTQRERESALHLYNPKRAWMMQSVAFGKRADTSLGTTVGSGKCTQPARRPIMPSGHEFGNNTNKVPFEDPEDAVLVRAMTRSLMEFSSVDWNKVATCQERRLENKAEEPLEKLTVQFR
ncbi:leucine-rich repeat-containing protein 72 isoform X4 [Serinus canaria]|uniref:leucine-rich repeat-containing protein 72 isoform X4 n=1 Tax=Serinus canaria TaxID=9135 RepID=UPI0008DB67A3|nr:leucine-rich repeat-containing protein 72 isoform X4 [Serinus canaria]